MSIFLLAFIPLNGDATSTVIFIEPQLTIVEIFHTFQINISISEVTDLAGWDFKLYYPNSLLNATEITEGPFLKTAGDTFFTVKEFTDNYNETHGRIWAVCVLQGQGSGATGNGTLATITFKAKLDGIATLHLAETDLIDSKIPPNHIIHTTIDGVVEVLGHDIAVTDVTLLKTVVGQGFTCCINVTIKNQGKYTETFNLTVYANKTMIGIRAVTLPDGNSTVITFTWNTEGFAKGLYIIEAIADVVPGETETADNTYIDSIIKIVLAGDINADNMVNYLDAIILGAAFSSQPNVPNWNPNADINNDNNVNYLDAIILGENFGKTDP